MNRVSFRRLIVATGLVLAVASVARADAPGENSGDSQYDPFDPGDPVIHDRHTGLYWERSAPSGVFTLDQAATYCSTLSRGTYTTGWRLPSYKELLTIVDETPHREVDLATGVPVYKAIDSGAFGFVDSFGVERTPVADPYWSSSIYVLDPSQAYAVNFKAGVTQIWPKSIGIFVRCVHD